LRGHQALTGRSWLGRRWMWRSWKCQISAPAVAIVAPSGP
jgi:hypothetical protein